MSEHDVNTDRFETTTKGVYHVEGGWSKDINPTGKAVALNKVPVPNLDMEATGRFRKKVEKDDTYQRTIVRLGGLVEQIIRQNNAIDVYEKYFTEEPVSQLKQDTPR